MKNKMSEDEVKSYWLNNLEHYIFRSKSLHDRDSDLRVKYNSVLSEDYQRYIDTEAIIYYQELHEVAVPFPCWTEMLSVGGETDIRKFLSIGYGCFKDVLSRIPQDKRNGNILDFGVGCGRTMRFFYRLADKLNCYGCDVDSRSIKYINEKVSFINAVVSENDPPLIFKKNFFDVIYCISVFTHFNKGSFQNWMREMIRVLKNDGLFILTLHGRNAFNIISKEPERRKMIGIKDEEFFNQHHRFEKEGFFWISQPLGSTDVDPEKFGICFLNEAFLQEYLPKEFQIQEYSVGAIGGWQDMVVLKKK